MTNTNHDNLDLGEDLVIAKTNHRPSGGGTWVRGTIRGHLFDALVFPGHAEEAEWEIGQSRISKLWIQRQADKETLYNWDRGLEQAPANQTAQQIVDFLCAGLAEQTFGK